MGSPAATARAGKKTLFNVCRFLRFFSRKYDAKAHEKTSHTRYALYLENLKNLRF